MEKQNSALRLHGFIEKMVPQQPDTIPTAQVLLNAFGVPKETPQREANAFLARIMLLLLSELESLVADLRRAGYSDQSMKPIVSPFDYLNAGGLANQWKNFRQGFAASLPVL